MVLQPETVHAGKCKTVINFPAYDFHVDLRTQLGPRTNGNTLQQQYMSNDLQAGSSEVGMQKSSSEAVPCSNSVHYSHFRWGAAEECPTAAAHKASFAAPAHDTHLHCTLMVTQSRRPMRGKALLRARNLANLCEVWIFWSSCGVHAL